MAAHTTTVDRRASASMYDPARDIYTVSDESAPADRSAKPHRPDGQAERGEADYSSASAIQQRTSQIQNQDPSNSLVRQVCLPCSTVYRERISYIVQETRAYWHDIVSSLRTPALRHQKGNPKVTHSQRGICLRSMALCRPRQK
jgi:hypothetical protein